MRKLLITAALLATLPTLCAGEPENAGAGMPAGQLRPNGTIFQGSKTAVRADISPPLRDIPPKLVAFPSKAENEEQTDPAAKGNGPLDLIDPVAQTWTTRGELPSAMPAPNVSFNGFANSCGGCAPPDPVGDIGPNHYVAMANSTIAVYSRAGAVLLTPRNINTLWTGFGGECEADNSGDPVVLYDQFADRWLVTQFTASGPTYYQCLALSTSPDPTGTWQRYAFNDGGELGDYPHYGIWRDGYYFSSRHVGVGQRAVAYNRTQMLAGSLTPTVIQFMLTNTTPYYGGDGLLPLDIDGSTLPAAGTDQIFVGLMDNGGPYGAPQDALIFFKFHADWTTPANSTFARFQDIPVAAFDSTFTPCGGGRACIPQSGTTNKLDILSYRQRVTHRAGYRNFGSHESVVLTHSVSGANSGTASAIAGMRWYEVRNPHVAPTIYQQSTYAPGATDSIHRWMGSVAMDRVGNIGLGYSASSGAMFPGIRYSGRLVTDPLSTMPQGEGIIVNGAGSQTGGGNRWGDYSSLNVDPTDDCTFWYVNEYYTATSTATWNLRIGSFTFPSCLCAVTPAAPVATGATTPANNQIAVAWNDAAGASITRYFVYRSTVSGGPYTQIATVTDTSPGAGGTGTYTYTDTGLSGGVTYFYVIRADDGVSCTSANSNQVSATATGPCTTPPNFTGASSCTNSAQATCGLSVSWTAGSKVCATASNTLTYNVYRSTTNGFTPSVANRIASGVAASPYSDTSGLANGTTYYYVVRAVDSLGNEDTNSVQVSAAPSGPISALLTDTFEGNQSGGGFDTAGWSRAIVSGTATWTWSTAQSNTPTHSWLISDPATSSQGTLTSPSFVPTAASTVAFYHTYAFENSYDGGTFEYTVNGGTNWTVMPDANFTAGGFNQTLNAANPMGAIRAWSGGAVGALTAVNANLGRLAGQTVQLRWRAASDASVGGTGWYIDSVNVSTASACTTGGGCTPPAGFNNNTAVDVSACGSTGVTINWSAPSAWNDVSGSRGYVVLRDGIPIASGPCSGTLSAATTSCVHTPGDGASHAYSVRAVNGCGGTTTTAGVNATDANNTLATPPVQTAPAAGNGQITVNWNALAGAATYQVKRGPSGGPYTNIGAPQAGTSYLDTGLANGTQYCYVLSATNACGTTGNSNQQCATPVSCAANVRLNDTFEGGTGNWTIAGTWATSTTTAGSPTTSLRGNDPGTNAQRNTCRTASTTAAIAIPGASTGAQLQFWSQSALAADDYGMVLVSTDGGTNWNKLTTVNYPGVIGAVPTATCAGTLAAGNPVFAGTSAGTLYRASLNAFAGQNLLIRFSFVTGGTSSASSFWYIDDVRVTDGNGVAGTMGTLLHAKSASDLAQSWPTAAGSENYAVYRGTTSNPAGWTSPVAVRASTATGWTDAGQLGNGTSQFYSVTLYNGCAETAK